MAHDPRDVALGREAMTRGLLDRAQALAALERSTAERCGLLEAARRLGFLDPPRAQALAALAGVIARTPSGRLPPPSGRFVAAAPDAAVEAAPTVHLQPDLSASVDELDVPTLRLPPGAAAGFAEEASAPTLRLPPGAEVPPPAAPAATGLPAPGDVVGGYRLERLLGQGGMGAVYVGVNDQGARRAVKVPLFSGPEAEDQRARFEREGRTLAKLSPHENVVRVHAAGQDGRHAFCVLELIEGQGLDSIVKKGGPLPIERVLTLGAGIARALAHCHDERIVHRDLKPANVLVRGNDGSPVLTDFGLARDAEAERLTKTGTLLGTPQYMPPEQVDGSPSIDARADVYSLGATLYELVTGKPPFQGATLTEIVKKVLLDAPAPPSRQRPDVPPDLETVILVALAKEPGHRYPSAAAMAEDLARIGRGEPIAARRPGLVARVVRRLRRRRREAALVTIAAVAIAVGLAFFVRKLVVDAAASAISAATKDSDASWDGLKDALNAGRSGWKQEALGPAIDRAAGAQRALLAAAGPRTDGDAARLASARRDDLTLLGLAALPGGRELDAAAVEALGKETPPRVRELRTRPADWMPRVSPDAPLEPLDGVRIAHDLAGEGFLAGAAWLDVAAAACARSYARLRADELGERRDEVLARFRALADSPDARRRKAAVGAYVRDLLLVLPPAHATTGARLALDLPVRGGELAAVVPEGASNPAVGGEILAHAHEKAGKREGGEEPLLRGLAIGRALAPHARVPVVLEEAVKTRATEVRGDGPIVEADFAIEAWRNGVSDRLPGLGKRGGAKLRDHLLDRVKREPGDWGPKALLVDLAEELGRADAEETTGKRRNRDDAPEGAAALAQRLHLRKLALEAADSVVADARVPVVVKRRTLFTRAQLIWRLDRWQEARRAFADLVAAGCEAPDIVCGESVNVITDAWRVEHPGTPGWPDPKDVLEDAIAVARQGLAWVDKREALSKAGDRAAFDQGPGKPPLLFLNTGLLETLPLHRRYDLAVLLLVRGGPGDFEEAARLTGEIEARDPNEERDCWHSLKLLDRARRGRLDEAVALSAADGFHKKKGYAFGLVERFLKAAGQEADAKALKARVKGD